MIDCSNATSLFEIGFGLNAVLTAISQSANSAKTRLLDAISLEAAKQYPQLHGKTLRGEDFQRLAFAGLRRFTYLIRFGAVVRLLALTVMAASVVTLMQAAMWGSTCKLEINGLYGYVGLAFFCAPLLYWSYRRLLEMIIEAAVRSDMPTKAATLLGRLAVANQKTDEALKIAEKLSQKYERTKARGALS